MPSAIYEKTFTIRFFEADWTGLVRPATLFEYFQEMAGAHASQIGVSLRDLLACGLTWVLSRVYLQVARYAAPGEMVTMRTWPSLRGERFTCREFELVDGAGDIIARATSSWAVLDLATRRPVRIDSRLPDYPLDPRRAVDDDFATLPRVEDEAPVAMIFPALRSDLDTNRHVNNVVYVRWGLETVPAEVGESCRPESIEVGFRAETFAGDRVAGRCLTASPDGLTFVHRLDSDDGRELTRLRTRWRPLAQFNAGKGEI